MSVELKVLPGGRGESAAPGPVLLDGGAAAIAEVLRLVGEARRSIQIRAFLWRDDGVGNAVARAVLAAADRGVRVSIHKDRIAAVYEYFGGNKQSFFHKRVDRTRRLQAWLLSNAYRKPGSARQRPSPLAQALLDHPNVSVDYGRKRFDHAKVLVVDDDRLLLGSMNIGDDHLHWLEQAVRIDGPEQVERLRGRVSGGARFDRSRGIDFLVHSREDLHTRAFTMRGERLRLIDEARQRLVVAMAYLGDPGFTSALACAVRRGVEVTLLTASRADVLGDLNLGILDQLLRRTGAPAHFRIFLYPRMVHAKAVLIDDRYADIGSANFTRLSNGVYDELNVYIDDPGFAREARRALEEHCATSRRVDERLRYRRLYFHVERAVELFQGRKKRV